MYTEQINTYFDDPARREELIAAVTRLVNVKSVKGDPAPGAPYGPGPRACLDEALAMCAEMGFTVQDYDHYVGLADLDPNKPTQLHILGHLDVVGEGTGWATDPYTCVEKDGILYGRGVSDDKGPVCAALLAMKAVREMGIPLSKNVRMIMGTDEESGSSDIAYYYAREPFAPMSFTPDANFPLINVEKGHFHPDFGASWEASEALPRVKAMKGGFRVNVVPPEAEAEVAGLKADDVAKSCAEIEGRTGVRFALADTEDGVRVSCTGKNAHAAMPQEGINAIQALLELLAGLPLAPCGSTEAVRGMHTLFPFGDTAGQGLGIAQEDALSGDLTLNLALMTLTETGFTAKFDARIPACATRENCAEACTAAMERVGIQVLGDDEMSHVHVVEPDSPLVKTLMECYIAYTGETEAKPLAIGGGTYVHNIPGGVAFGCEFPGFDPKMHSANEQASVDLLLKSAKIFALAIVKLCA